MDGTVSANAWLPNGQLRWWKTIQHKIACSTPAQAVPLNRKKKKKEKLWHKLLLEFSQIKEDERNSLSLSRSLLANVSVSLYVSQSLPLTLRTCQNISFYVNFCLCLCLSVFPSLSLSLLCIFNSTCLNIFFRRICLSVSLQTA